MEDKNFKEFLKEQIEARGFTAEKLSEQTGIAERHVEALIHGETGKLPSLPYVRGYLAKIARVLELNSNALWNIYSREYAMPTSGSVDRLPINRYAMRSVNKKWGAVLLLLGIIAVYLIGNAGRLFGAPPLEIKNPPSETTATNIDTITLSGTMDPSDKLLIGGEEVVPDTTGVFSKEYPLQPGLNQIEFTIKRFLGKEITLTRKVIYQP